MLKLFSDSDVLEDERSKIEQEVMEALSQAKLPPLGTAMYDGVWEWVYELVTEAEKAELMLDDGTRCIEKALSHTQPAHSPEVEPGYKGTEVKVPQEMMDISEQDTGNQGYLMELPNLEPAPDSSPALPSSEHNIISVDNQLSREKPQEAPTPPGESQLPQSKTSSSSERSSESDSPLTHSSVRSKLLHQCLYGVAVCAVRCPTYFKPLYRLSSALLELGLPKVYIVYLVTLR